MLVSLEGWQCSEAGGEAGRQTSGHIGMAALMTA